MKNQKQNDFRVKFKKKITVVDNSGIIGVIHQKGQPVKFEVQEQSTTQPYRSGNVIRVSGQISLQQKYDQMETLSNQDLHRQFMNLNYQSKFIDNDGDINSPLENSWVMQNHSYPLSQSKIYVTSPYLSQDMPKYHYDQQVVMPNYLYKIDREPPLSNSQAKYDSVFNEALVREEWKKLNNSSYINPLRGVDSLQQSYAVDYLMKNTEKMLQRRRNY